MHTTVKPASAPVRGARDALEKSEKKAFANEPGEFADPATTHKIVRVGPELDKAPIKGIDRKK